MIIAGRLYGIRHTYLNRIRQPLQHSGSILWQRRVNIWAYFHSSLNVSAFTMMQYCQIPNWIFHYFHGSKPLITLLPMHWFSPPCATTQSQFILWKWCQIISRNHLPFVSFVNQSCIFQKCNYHDLFPINYSPLTCSMQAWVQPRPWGFVVIKRLFKPRHC